MLNTLEHFIKLLGWQAFFFDQQNDEMEDRDECFGFKSEKNLPPQDKELIAFEEDLYALVKSIKFSKKKQRISIKLN